MPASTAIHTPNGKTIPITNLPTGIFSVPATIDVGTISPGMDLPIATLIEEWLFILFPAFSNASGLILAYRLIFANSFEPPNLARQYIKYAPHKLPPRVNPIIPKPGRKAPRATS